MVSGVRDSTFESWADETHTQELANRCKKGKRNGCVQNGEGKLRSTLSGSGVLPRRRPGAKVNDLKSTTANVKEDCALPNERRKTLMSGPIPKSHTWRGGRSMARDHSAARRMEADPQGTACLHKAPIASKKEN